MRRARLLTWKDLARSDEAAQLHPAYRKYTYFVRRHWLNKRSLLAALIGSSLLAGLHGRAGFVAALGLTLFGAYLYLKAKAVADALVLRRVVPPHAVEGDTIEVGWRLSNRSAFGVRDVRLLESFDGSLSSRRSVWLEGPVAPFESLEGSNRFRCDAGMGTFGFGELAAIVADPLGVFEFIVCDDGRGQVEVVPRIEPIPPLPVPGSRESFLYGVYDLPTRGASVNFAGIRDFTRGDPLRHIAWRRSMRHGRLLVKQFEKIANCEISVLLNMDERDHAGRKAESTWEYSKDAVLALVTQQMTLGNSLQLLSGPRCVPWGRGESHAHLIAREVFALRPRAEPSGVNVVRRFGALVPPSSTAVFVGPVLGSDSLALARALFELRERGIQLLCILVEPSGFLLGKVQGEFHMLAESTAWKAKKAVESLAHRLRAGGVPTYVLEAGEAIGPQLLPEKGRAA